MLSKICSFIWAKKIVGISEDQVAEEFLELKLIRQNKIHNDRQRLMDRMSSRLKPFPVGTFEKLSQNNIWETVLEYLDPATLGSAQSCCQSFQFLSEESLLVHVLSILKNNGWLHLKRRDSEDISYWKNNHNIWNLRLVSKSWKRATEQVYFNTYCKPSWYADLSERRPHSSPILADCTPEKKLNRACNALKRSKSGTQLFQLVELLNMDCTQATEATLDFLDKYGHLIQAVYLHNYYFYSGSAARYLVLVKCLKMLPNLKVLVVNCHCTFDHDTDTTSDLLRAQINKFPIPTIPSLRMIKFCHGIEHGLTLNEIMRANQHVKSLQLPKDSPVTPEMTFQMEKLNELTEYSVGLGRGGTTEQILVLRQFHWPYLRHLRLNLIQHAIMPYNELFKLVNKFSSTLETLSLYLYPFYFRHHVQLELPNLKKMEMAGPWRANAWLDFLLPCRSLEQLEFSNLRNVISDSDRPSCTFILKCRNVLFPSKFRRVLIGNKVQESKVWAWFPRLACVRIAELKHFRYCVRQEHYVRKFGDVFKVSIDSDCKIKCKYE